MRLAQMYMAKPANQNEETNITWVVETGPNPSHSMSTMYRALRVGEGKFRCPRAGMARHEEK
jgi:hypothetical protein